MRFSPLSAENQFQRFISPAYVVVIHNCFIYLLFLNLTTKAVDPKLAYKPTPSNLNGTYQQCQNLDYTIGDDPAAPLTLVYKVRLALLFIVFFMVVPAPVKTLKLVQRFIRWFNKWRKANTQHRKISSDHSKDHEKNVGIVAKKANQAVAITSNDITKKEGAANAEKSTRLNAKSPTQLSKLIAFLSKYKPPLLILLLSKNSWVRALARAFIVLVCCTFIIDNFYQHANIVSIGKTSVMNLGVSFLPLPLVLIWSLSLYCHDVGRRVCNHYGQYRWINCIFSARS